MFAKRPLRCARSTVVVQMTYGVDDETGAKLVGWSPSEIGSKGTNTTGAGLIQGLRRLSIRGFLR